MSTPLPDGRYDAFVVDVASDEGGVTVGLELTIVAGDHKGEVIEVGATGLDGGVIELLGMPATLEVTGGVPSVTIEA